MLITDFLKKIAVNLEKKNNPMFSFPVEKQKEYLKQFPESKDNIEKSYYQYRCQKLMSGKVVNVIVSIGSAFIYKLLEKKYLNNEIEFKENIQAIFFADGKPDNIIPRSLKESLGEYKVINEQEYVLMEEDVTFLKKVKKRYPFAFEFQLKMLIKIARYRAMVNMYKSKEIVVCAEYSFTSSALTEWCHNNSIKHYNVMHGEKVFYIRDSFFKFDKCYVWNQHYRELLKNLRADEEQFIIEEPESLHFDKKKNIKKEMDITYYLAAESQRELKIIAEFLKKIKMEKGKKVAVRPHPRYSDMKYVEEYFGELVIEDVKTLPIEKSILRTKTVIAVYSTVLNQAYSNGIPIVIDNISAPEKYKKLEELQYIFAAKGIRTVSDLIKGE